MIPVFFCGYCSYSNEIVWQIQMKKNEKVNDTNSTKSSVPLIWRKSSKRISSFSGNSINCLNRITNYVLNFVCWTMITLDIVKHNFELWRMWISLLIRRFRFPRFWLIIEHRKWSFSGIKRGIKPTYPRFKKSHLINCTVSTATKNSILSDWRLKLFYHIKKRMLSSISK